MLMKMKADQGTCKKETTELVFVIDRSGSMAGLEEDTIGGYNATIEKQRHVPGFARVTTVLFDHRVEQVLSRVDLAGVAPMTRKHYQPGGCTALFDAIGQTIRHINKAQKADIAGRPDHTIFVITTDGMENSSSTYTLEKVRKMIEKRKAKNGWEFIFLGANIDAIATAGGMGIEEDRAATYVGDAEGTKVMYACASAAVKSIRCSAPMSASWKHDIDADLAARG